MSAVTLDLAVATAAAKSVTLFSAASTSLTMGWTLVEISVWSAWRDASALRRESFSFASLRDASFATCVLTDATWVSMSFWRIPAWLLKSLLFF